MHPGTYGWHGYDTQCGGELTNYWQKKKKSVFKWNKYIIVFIIVIKFQK